MNPEADQIRTKVFGCEHCADLGVFTKAPDNGRIYKYPPIIGAQGEADLLFVGINPRRSGTNLDLHEWLIGSPEAFAKLAINRLKDGKAYIAPDGEEEHYHCHMIVVEGVFGTGTAFEAKAAVTELMHCASPNEPLILSRKKSPCAELYLRSVVGIVKPQVVIAVGSGVRRHLQKHFNDEFSVHVVPMEHPGPLFGASRVEKARRMQPTIDEVRGILGRRGCNI